MVKLKTLLRFLPHLPAFLRATLAMRNQRIESTRAHIGRAADWLMAIQRHGEEGGYPSMYSLITGLGGGYVETTGYIIPTMLDIAEVLGRPECRQSAFQAADWLLAQQLPAGGFPDFDGQPQVFDTGQVMFGLHRMYRETGEQRFLDAALRAGRWLASVQDSDGAWTGSGYYQDQPRTYHTRVAAALVELARISGETEMLEAGRRNLDWTVSKQQPNGFFGHANLEPDAPPLLHTMVYVLEGLLHAHLNAPNPQWFDALLRAARGLLRVNLDRDLLLRSHYQEDYSVACGDRCLTGLAQWAKVCLDLYGLTGDEEFVEAAQLSLYYLKSKQLSGPELLHGSLPGSIPIWGSYQPLCFINWGVKFFADALLAYDRLARPPWQEQERWVGRCLQLGLDGGAWLRAANQVGPMDGQMMRLIERDVKRLVGGDRPPDVLDLGCGVGRYMGCLGQANPDWRIVGIDPCHEAPEHGIRRGSAYEIPHPDGSFDAVYTFIVMQHIGHLDRAFAEIRRVLRPGGMLFIGDRDLLSLRGLLKPYHELKGLWIYPWDSPFRERWYTRGQWRRILARHGFRTVRVRGMQNPLQRGLRRLLRLHGFVAITGLRR